MSVINEYIIERQNEQQELKLASLLGITIDELSNLNYDIYDDEGHDGTLYGYIVKFNSNSSKDILCKIRGLDSNNQVWIDLWDLDNSDSKDYDEYKYELGSSTYNSHIYYKDSISKVMILLSAKIDNSSLLEIFHRQIYISVISYFETFLWLTVVNLTKENPLFIEKIINNHPLFKQEAYLNKSKQEKIEITKTLINSIPYSDLEHKVRVLYKSAFDIEIPKDNKLVGVSRGHYNMMLLAGIMEILSATIKEMRVGPSQSVYRNRLQTITSCVLSNQKVVNVVCNKSEDMVRYV